MKFSTKLQSNSLRLLLYLEWILLGIMALSELPLRIHNTSQPFPWLVIISISAFGLMGLRLPNHRLISKIIYTGLEFFWMLLPMVMGDRLTFFPLLCLIVVIRSCLVFKQLGRLIVSGIVLAVFLLMLFTHPTKDFPPLELRGPYLSNPRPPLPPSLFERLPAPPNPTSEEANSMMFKLKLNAAFTFGLTILFILLLINAWLAERQSREKLLLANEQLRHYALRIEDQATLQERNRIAREIHDSLGHYLTAQSIQLENALLFLHPQTEKAEAFLIEAKQLGTKALQEVRQSIATLRSDPLQGKPLDVVLKDTLDEFSFSNDMTCQCIINLSQPLPQEINTAIYRIVQEALTNVCKHSDASAVTVQVSEKVGAIHLLIQDNGKGFDVEQNTTGFGLQGMRERAIALGGQFRIVSQLGNGCTLNILLPLVRLEL